VASCGEARALKASSASGHLDWPGDLTEKISLCIRPARSADENVTVRALGKPT